MSGPHKNLEGKIPITLGTIPLANTQSANAPPYTDVPSQTYTDVPSQPIQDPSLAPTQPVSPASPPPTGAANGNGLPGWNMGTIYPTIRRLFFNSNIIIIEFEIIINIHSSLLIAPPSYAESEFRANIVDKNDSQHIRVAPGQNEFAPRYPTYTAAALPPLPNFK